MIHEAYTDHGTVLRSDQFAIAANMDGRFSLYFPHMADDAELPLNFQLLAVVAAKIDNEEWVEEMLSSLRERC